MKVIFTFFILFLALWLEVSLSSLDIVMPLLMIELFYLTVVYKWRYSFLTALVACSILDSLLGYYSLPAAIFVIIVASFWRTIGDCSKVELQFLPVSVTIFAALLIIMACVYFSYGGVIPVWNWFVQLFGGVLLTVFFTPFIIRFQDFIARKLKVFTYADVQREEMYSASNK